MYSTNFLHFNLPKCHPSSDLLDVPKVKLRPQSEGCISCCIFVTETSRLSGQVTVHLIGFLCLLPERFKFCFDGIRVRVA